MNNFNELYLYANRIAGELGNDLVHHVYLETQGKHFNNRNAYFKTCIRNQYYNKDSTFNKLYRLDELELHDIEDVHIISDNYDSQLLHRIFLQLEMEGYSNQVQVYKDCKLVGSIHRFSKESKINERTITKICNFVHNEIIRRYNDMDLD
tara:strand:- start:33794 stop:34243 length:450 start_codon:yes stop_codon:yes gene_type:complete